MSRMYVAYFDATAVTAAIFDFFEFTPADDKPVVLHSAFISQITEVGDAQEEFMEITIRRGGTAMTSGSGGAAGATPVGLDATYAAAGFTYEVCNTTEATFTAGVEVHHEAFNVRTGWQYRPTPEERLNCSQANGGFVIRCESTPVDSISFVGTAIIEELG